MKNPESYEGNNRDAIWFWMLNFVCLSVCHSVAMDLCSPVPAPLKIARTKTRATTGFVCFFGTVDLFRFKINCKEQNIPRTRDSKPRKVEARTQEKQCWMQKTWMLFTISSSKNMKYVESLSSVFLSLSLYSIYTSYSFVPKLSLIWLSTVESLLRVEKPEKHNYIKVQTKGAFVTVCISDVFVSRKDLNQTVVFWVILWKV